MTTPNTQPNPDDAEKGIEAMRFVMEEREAQWQDALTMGHKPDVLACRWLLIYAPEAYVRMVQDGLSIGNALDMMRDHGHRLPPEIEPVHAAWHAKIVEYDLKRPYWDRHTPEGQAAVVGDRKAEQLESRRQRRRLAEIFRADREGRLVEFLESRDAEERTTADE